MRDCEHLVWYASKFWSNAGVPVHSESRINYKNLRKEEAGTQMMRGMEIHSSYFMFCPEQHVLFQMCELSGKREIQTTGQIT